MGIFANLIERMKVASYNQEQYIEYLRKQGVHIGNGCSIHKSVGFGNEGFLIYIDDNVRITAGVRIIPHDGGLWTLRKMGLMPDADYFAPIHIGKNVHIGNDAIIMPGITIGENSIIGVGAIVTKDVPANSVVAGVPARIIETIEEYYEKRKNVCDNTKHMDHKEKRTYYSKKFGMEEN